MDSKKDEKYCITAIKKLIENIDELSFYDYIMCNATITGYIQNLTVDNISEFTVKIHDVKISYCRDYNCTIEYGFYLNSFREFLNKNFPNESDNKIVNSLLDYVFDELTEYDTVELRYNQFED